jgi:Dullard-like phosphatase family protein
MTALTGPVSIDNKLPKKFPSSSVNFMANVFRKTEAITSIKQPTEGHKPFWAANLQRTNGLNKCGQKPTVSSKDKRLHSCSKNNHSFTPNSKSFDANNRPPKQTVSPENLKTGFLLGKKRLKTSLLKSPVCHGNQPLAKNDPRVISPDKLRTVSAFAKVSSARTSPQLAKLKSPLLLKVVSKDKQSHPCVESTLVGKTVAKPNLASGCGSFTLFKHKVIAKLATKNNKENMKREENKSQKGRVDCSAVEALKNKQAFQKNCMFANLVNHNGPPIRRPPTEDPHGAVFKHGFNDKLNVSVLESHYTQVMGLYNFFLCKPIALEVVIEEYVRTLRHSAFTDLTSQFVHDNRLAVAYELFFKLEVVFVLFLIPLNHLSPANEPLRMSFEALCLNLFCYVKTVRAHLKTSGRHSVSEHLGRLLSHDQLPLSFRSPTATLDTVSENNSFLSSTIHSQTKQSSNKLVKRTLNSLMAKTVELSLCKFVPFALDTLSPFFEKLDDASLASQSHPDHSHHTRSDSHMHSSLFCDEEDPYFILQPLKLERYLPGKDAQAPALTLVLDLDETLVHFAENESNGKFLVRPFAREFLVRMSRHFEIIVFTAALKDYADWILDRIDTARHIAFRLYREHTTFQNGIYLKDLSRLNRDLTSTIIVDNNADNFQMHPENGIYIKSWYEDPNDSALKHLANLLARIAESKEKDVRVALANFNRKMTANSKEHS